MMNLLMLVAASLALVGWGQMDGDDDGSNVEHYWVYQTSPEIPCLLPMLILVLTHRMTA